MSWNLEETVEYYKRQGAPGDQSALVSLLREVQQECGGAIPVYHMVSAAELLNVKESLLMALIRRIPSLRLADSHCLDISSDLSGNLRRAKLQQTWRIGGLCGAKLWYKTGKIHAEICALHAHVWQGTQYPLGWQTDKRCR